MPNEVREEVRPRYATRDQTTAVTFSTQSVVIETTAHETFEQLSDLFRVAIEARQEVAPVDGLVRLGLRYVDEIGSPMSAMRRRAGPSGWTKPCSAPSPKAPRLALQPSSGKARSSSTGTRAANSGCATGPGLGTPSPPAALSSAATPSPGPFFLIDMDSFWTPTDEVPEFSAQVIARKCAELHRARSRPV